MRRRHLRGVMAIERQVYPRPWSPNLFLSEMAESRNRCYLVARIDREVVGYGGLICYGEEAHITNVAVDPLRQGQGIASRLLNDLIGAAVELEVEEHGSIQPQPLRQRVRRAPRPRRRPDEGADGPRLAADRPLRAGERVRE